MEATIEPERMNMLLRQAPEGMGPPSWNVANIVNVGEREAVANMVLNIDGVGLEELVLPLKGRATTTLERKDAPMLEVVVATKIEEASTLAPLEFTQTREVAPALTV